MMQNVTLPPELITSLGSETRDFALKAERAQPLKKSFSIILFGAIWTAFSSLFVFMFLGPLFWGQEVRFKSNGVPIVASPSNLGPIIMPSVVIGLFVLIGIFMLSWGVYSMLKKGGYFVGTPTRLVSYQNGNIRSIDWELFSGDIEVAGKGPKGDITLQMRTGRMVSRKNAPDRYVPDAVYLAGIPDAFEIEQICRKRIKENDPTPLA